MISAIVLGLTTVATAWSAYQSNLWSGVQAFALEASLAEGRAATEKAVLAGQRRSLDGTIVMNFSNAWVEGKQELSDFYLKRMRSELREAVQAWLDTKPLENPNSPPHPLAMPEYEEKVKSKLDSEIEKHKLASQKNLDTAQHASDVSDNYVLLTVLLASVLFFEAIASKFRSRKVEIGLLVVAFIIFVVVTGILATLPITRG